MFTGIVTHIAAIKSAEETPESLQLTIEKPAEWTDLAVGESINTNGVCLTVTAIQDESYTCELVPETLEKTVFGIKVPERVNLERALTVKDRFGGHFVQGHVDGVGKVTGVDSSDGVRLSVQFDAADRRLVIPKGSITINGVALTVAGVETDRLSVALIPHTWDHTTLSELNTGDPVNLEYDMLGKYVLNSVNFTKES